MWKTKAKTQKMVLKISIYLLARRKQQKHDNLLGTSVARTRWFNVPLQSPLPKNYAIRTRDSAYWEQPPPQRVRASASGESSCLNFRENWQCFPTFLLQNSGPYSMGLWMCFTVTSSCLAQVRAQIDTFIQCFSRPVDWQGTEVKFFLFLLSHPSQAYWPP